MLRRRLLIILIGLLVIGALGAGAYYLGRATGLIGDSSGTLPEIGGDFAQVETMPTDLIASTIPLEPVAAYHAYEDGSIVSVQRDGSVSRRSGTNVTSLSSAAIPGFSTASFSGDGSRILVLTGTQPRSQVSIFTTGTASWRTIPGSFRDAAWGPRGTQLATLTRDEKTGKTVVALYDTATGRVAQTLATLALGDVSIAWPAADTVIVTDKPNSRSRGSAWAIDIPTKKISLLARGKEGFDALWDKTGRTGIAFEAKGFGTGGTATLYKGPVPAAKLAFTTLPEKCAFADLPNGASSTEPYLICAVPEDQDAFQRFELPDAWLRRQALSTDVIVGVSMETRDVAFSIAPPLPMDVSRIQVVGTTVYYTDRASDLLYKSDI